MTDPDLILKKLAFIETCLSLSTGLVSPAETSSIVRDVLEKHLGDIEQFVAEIRKGLSAE